MARQNRIVILGGNACGPKTAARARRCDPLAKITLVEQEENFSVATCGLPYYISGDIGKRDDLIQRKSDYFRNVMALEVLNHTRASAIDCKAHKVAIAALKTERISNLEYDKLVLATGSTPLCQTGRGQLWEVFSP